MKFCLLLCGHLVLLLVCLVESLCTTGMDLDGPKTSDELEKAIDKATDGLIIELLPIEYKGDFVLQTKTSNAKVTIKGSEGCDKRSTIVGSGAALSVKKGIWTISNVDIEGGTSGVVLNGPNNVLEFINIKNVEYGFTINGNGNTIRNCSVTETHNGIIIKASVTHINDVALLGTLIQIQGSNNTLKHVSIAEIPHGSTGVLINKKASYNTLDTFSLDDGVVKVKGDFNTIFHLNGMVIIVEGDFNNLHDVNMDDSVTVTGDSNTFHELNAKDSVINGKNNKVNVLNANGGLFVGCGNIVMSASYTSGNVSSASCN